MAQLAGFNTTSDNDLVATETIGKYIIPAANFIRVYEAVTWMAPASGAAFRWPRWDAVAVTGTHTEQDELAATSFPTSNEQVTGAVVGVFALATAQLAAAGSGVTEEMQVAQMVDEERNRIDKDVIAALGGATNVSDFSAANLGLDNFETALAAFKAQKPNMPRIAFIGSTNQVRDLRKAIRSSGNGGLIMGAGNDLYNGMTRAGFQGYWAGVEIYEGNTTEADADNDAGGFCACAPMGQWTGANDLASGGEFQRGSGLGLAVWALNGTYGVYADSLKNPRRIATDLVVSAMYGAAVTADHLVRAFISKKAAA